MKPHRVCFLPPGHCGECPDLSLEKPNELAQKIMRKVDELPPTVDRQVRFPEAHNLATVKPKLEYQAAMLQVMG